MMTAIAAGIVTVVAVGHGSSLSLFSFWLALSLYLSVSQAVSSLDPPFRGLVVVVGCGGSDFPSTSWPSFVERYPLSLSFFLAVWRGKNRVAATAEKANGAKVQTWIDDVLL